MNNGRGKSNTYYSRIYSLFLPIFRLIAWIKYGVRVKNPVHFDEPVLVLVNHTTDMDFLVTAAHISNHMYFVVSRHVLSLWGPFGTLFSRWFNPIGVFKGGAKPAEVMEMIRRVRSGGSVYIHPEGMINHNGRTHEIKPAAAKLAKMMKCKVVTFRIDGGYFKQPRWQNYMNKGKIFKSGIVNIYDKETVAAMSVDELLGHIQEDLNTDAYALQPQYMHKFRLKNGLRDIVRYYDVCPSCRGIDTIRGEGYDVICSCGYRMHYDEYGYFHGDPQLVSTTPDWEKIQNETYSEYWESGGIFKDEDIELCTVGEKFEKTLCCKGELSADCGGMSIGGYYFDFSEIDTPEIILGGKIMCFSKGRTNYILEKDGVCFNKYIDLHTWSRSHSVMK